MDTLITSRHMEQALAAHQARFSSEISPFVEGILARAFHLRPETEDEVYAVIRAEIDAASSPSSSSSSDEWKGQARCEAIVEQLSEFLVLSGNEENPAAAAHQFLSRHQREHHGEPS